MIVWVILYPNLFDCLFYGEILKERQLISNTISVFLIKVVIFFVDYRLVALTVFKGNGRQGDLDNFEVDFRYSAYYLCLASWMNHLVLLNTIFLDWIILTIA